MKRLLKCLLICAALAAIGLTACSEKSSTNSDPKDTDGPGLVVTDGPDTVQTDTVILSGTVVDESGVDKITTVSGGQTVFASLSGSAWTMNLDLVSGLNSIVVTAEDNEGNTTQGSASVFYLADYMPMTDSSYWKFQGSPDVDSVTFRVDSSSSFLGRKFFRLNIHSIRGDTNIFILLHQNVFRMDNDTNTLMDSEDTLFLKQYTPATTAYEGNTVRFVGDSLIGGETVRNCVKVTYPELKAILVITELVLAPNRGLVAIKANGFGGYALVARR